MIGTAYCQSRTCERNMQIAVNKANAERNITR
jgi:hypothetical protein